MAEWDEAEGINSAWYVVGSYYDIDHHMLSDLESRGHEIGLHGAVHDNRLADLAGMSLGRVGRGGRQQLEDRALAAALESNKSGFHCDDSATGPRRFAVRLNRSHCPPQRGRRRGSSRSVVPVVWL